MVTIEQKIILFSKLIYQLMNTNFKEVLQGLESEYDKKFDENKKDIDLQVKKIINNAHKKRDLELLKINGSLKINEKRELMLQKENFFNRFMDKLEVYVDKFVKSDAYENYLLKLVSSVGLENSDIKDISLYLSKDDYVKYYDLLSKEFRKIGYLEDKFKIYVSNHNIIGGFIIEDNINKFKFDLSIKSLLEDNEDYIMGILFEALERE